MSFWRVISEAQFLRTEFLRITGLLAHFSNSASYPLSDRSVQGICWPFSAGRSSRLSSVMTTVCFHLR
jgi:hypothetical protein